MNQTYLEKRDTARNQARFYRLTVQPNLFGEWTLCKEWGRIGSRGQTRLDYFGTENQAQAGLSKIEEQKRRRGYLS